MKTPLVEHYKTIYLLINNLLEEYFLRTVVYNIINSVKSLLELFGQGHYDRHPDSPLKNGQGITTLSRIRKRVKFMVIGVYKISSPGVFKIMAEEALNFRQTLYPITNLDFKGLIKNGTTH